MPPIVAAAAIGAGATPGGSALASRGANRAGEIQAQAAERALQFQREEAARAERNFQETQRFNRSVYTDQQARLAPYRALGAGTIQQLGQPIPQNPMAPFKASGV